MTGVGGAQPPAQSIHTPLELHCSAAAGDAACRQPSGQRKASAVASVAKQPRTSAAKMRAIR